MNKISSTHALNNPKEIRGWVMYDWAFSAFSTVVGSTLLGPYLLALAKSSQVPIQFFGRSIEAAAIFPLSVSLSVFLQVFILPLVGTASDLTPHRKKIMLGFGYTGAVATIFLFAVHADYPWMGIHGAVILGSLLFVIANLCFGASAVPYHAYLPDIASPEQRDRVSSRGFAWGYAGGGVLLVLILGLIFLMPENRGLAVRIGLASAGTWWLVFAWIFPQRRLRDHTPKTTPSSSTNLLRLGVQRLLKSLRELRDKYPTTLKFFIAYLIYNDGIQTVNLVATSFAADELKASTSTLLILVVVVQFVAFGGTYLFGWLASRIGAKRTILASLVIWLGITLFAWLYLNSILQLFVLGGLVGLVIGGTQALSRSLFSQMIPADHQAEYFGLYEISERGTSWLGPLLFALAVQWTGSQRIAIGALSLFFVLGIILLLSVNPRKGMEDVGVDPAGVVF
jgi:MFS transporter, UMF1 family